MPGYNTYYTGAPNTRRDSIWSPDIRIILLGWCCHHLRICSSLTNSLGSQYITPLILIFVDRGRNSYKNGETTTASVGRICTERSVGVNVDVNPFEPHILASNLAHAIGHNLGFGHDDMPGSSGKKNETFFLFISFNSSAKICPTNMVRRNTGHGTVDSSDWL